MPEKGRLILVGAGPGDPGLMTLAGREALEGADVVLHDRLIGSAIAAMLPPAALKIDVGKHVGDHPIPQDEINRLIVEHALAGKTVVRLKGGDPFLFGRGAEELEAARERGIPFRVIPGITAAVAVPELAGIPVTHRDHSSSLHIFTGRGKRGNPPEIPYEHLAGLKGTLVFFMALAALEEICGKLVAAGLPSDTPAAVVENGSYADQRRLVATLADLPGQARRAAIASPALLIVGKTCLLAERYDATTALPLGGVRILSVSSRITMSRLAAGLREYGARVDEFQGVVQERLPQSDRLFATLPQYQWIAFTSPFGADSFFSEMLERRIDIRTLAAVKFAAVGGRTAAELTRRGIFPAFVPEEYNGKALGRGLLTRMRDGERILLYRAREANDDLGLVLRDGGGAFDDVAAYRTVRNALPAKFRAALRSGAYALVTFTSASSAEALAASADSGDLSPLTAVCIGETSAAAARLSGMNTVTCPEASIESMVECVIKRAGRQ